MAGAVSAQQPLASKPEQLLSAEGPLGVFLLTKFTYLICLTGRQSRRAGELAAAKWREGTAPAGEAAGGEQGGGGGGGQAAGRRQPRSARSAWPAGRTRPAPRCCGSTWQRERPAAGGAGGAEAAGPHGQRRHPGRPPLGPPVCGRHPPIMVPRRPPGLETACRSR